MGIEQKLIQEAIDRGEYIAVCCVTGLVRVPGTNQYIGFRFKEYYENITHTYMPEYVEDILKIERMKKEMYKRNKNA